MKPMDVFSTVLEDTARNVGLHLAPAVGASGFVQGFFCCSYFFLAFLGDRLCLVLTPRSIIYNVNKFKHSIKSKEITKYPKKTKQPSPYILLVFPTRVGRLVLKQSFPVHPFQ